MVRTLGSLAIFCETAGEDVAPFYETIRPLIWTLTQNPNIHVAEASIEVILRPGRCQPLSEMAILPVLIIERGYSPLLRHVREYYSPESFLKARAPRAS